MAVGKVKILDTLTHKFGTIAVTAVPTDATKYSRWTPLRTSLVDGDNAGSIGFQVSESIRWRSPCKTFYIFASFKSS